MSGPRPRYVTHPHFGYLSEDVTRYAPLVLYEPGPNDKHKHHYAKALLRRGRALTMCGEKLPVPGPEDRPWLDPAWQVPPVCDACRTAVNAHYEAHPEPPGPQPREPHDNFHIPSHLVDLD